LKRIVLFLCLALFAWQLPILAEESGHGGGHGSDNSTLWKIVNFAILAGALGYLIGKNAPAFFQGRSEQIRKGLDDAARISAEAEARTVAITKKLAALQSEIEELKRAARAELAADQARAQEEAGRMLAKVNEHAQQDIDAAGKAARHELKAYAAGLSVELAEEQIRGQMNSGTEDALVNSFAEELRTGRRAEA